MPNFRYRALTQGGEIVNGSISAANAVEVAHRIEYLGLVPIDTVAEEAGGALHLREPLSPCAPGDIAAQKRVARVRHAIVPMMRSLADTTLPSGPKSMSNLVIPNGAPTTL